MLNVLNLISDKKEPIDTPTTLELPSTGHVVVAAPKKTCV